MLDANEKLALKLEGLTRTLLINKYSDFSAEELAVTAEQETSFIASQALVLVCRQRIYSALTEDNTDEAHSYQSVLPQISHAHHIATIALCEGPSDIVRHREYLIDETP